MAPTMFLTNISIQKAENGFVVHLSFQGKSNTNLRFNREEHVFKDDEQDKLTAFVNSKLKDLSKV